ncbi:hypothetical protein JB92DRAFT_2859750 [Gautieria morchelliformis]|nr:hypothetical protein JB92DRAFT_2859750 [Gautieria morchelliformis]
MPSLVDSELVSIANCPSETHFSTTRVFPLIHALKEDVNENLDSALSWEQLTASDINFTIIRPLVLKYSSLNNLATVYACLVVRSNFLRLSDESLAHANLNTSRAMMCELLAMKFMRHFSNHIELVAILTHSWSPLAGAPHQVVSDIQNGLSRDHGYGLDESTSALEMAISTNSKTFLSAPLTQSVVNDIYSGRVVFSTASRHSLVADNYKQRQIEFYDCRTAPLLDHYRLRVPRYQAILEMANFAILCVFFTLCLAKKDLHEVTIYEKVFMMFGLAFVLAEYTATRENGWRIYMANLWNVFDTTFIVIWIIYFVLRIKGVFNNDELSSGVSFDILACGACILFPRLAFFAVSNNVVVLSLRGMIADFVFFMTIAAISFSGLLFTLWQLAQLERGNRWDVKSIAWLMTQVWFGNTELTFEQAESFHPVFGPILMIAFAALSNTLLITILTSILTNTFARIDENATEEYLFQFTISTIEGVKSDALFSYQPPFNLLAYAILAPMSYLVSPRTLHKANVLLIRITSFPILIIISVYERYIASGSIFWRMPVNTAHSFFNSLPRLVGSRTTDLHKVIFDVEVPPMDLFDEAEEEETRALRSFRSRESLDKHQAPDLRFSRTQGSGHSSPRPSERLPPTSPGLRPRSHSRHPAELSSSDLLASPLARIYTRRPLSVPDVIEGVPTVGESVEDILGSIRKVEVMMEGISELPVARLRTEMKELQDRQARIENLLMTLTRGMRGDMGVSRTTSH